MTSPPITYVEVPEMLQHPIDRVWRRIAVFGGLEHWAAGVGACTVEGSGVGAIRTVSLGGRQVRERLEAIDDAAHTLRYRILPPHAMPADDVHGNVVLRAIDAATTEMVWRSDATQFHADRDVLATRIGQFYRESIAGLRAVLDAG